MRRTQIPPYYFENAEVMHYGPDSAIPLHRAALTPPSPFDFLGSGGVSTIQHEERLQNRSLKS